MTYIPAHGMVDTVVDAESKEAVAADDLPTELFPSDIWPHLSMEEWGLQEGRSRLSS